MKTLDAPSASGQNEDRAARRLARPARDTDGSVLTEAPTRRGVAQGTHSVTANRHSSVWARLDSNQARTTPARSRCSRLQRYFLQAFHVESLARRFRGTAQTGCTLAHLTHNGASA